MLESRVSQPFGRKLAYFFKIKFARLMRLFRLSLTFAKKLCIYDRLLITLAPLRAAENQKIYFSPLVRTLFQKTLFLPDFPLQFPFCRKGERFFKCQSRS